MSSYYNTGGGSGGGYMQASQGTPNTPGGRSNTTQTLRPLVLRQAIDATQSHNDNAVVIDGIEVSQVTFVAQVLTATNQNTNLVVKFDDGTAQMEGRQWIEAGPSVDVEEIKSSQGLVDNQWVRVMGNIKTFNNRRHINIQHSRPVTDFHEVYFALLEAMNVHKQLTKPGAAGTSDSNAMQVDAYTGGAVVVASKDTFSLLPPLQRKIIDFILKNSSGDEGLHVAVITKGLGQVDASQVSDALEALSDGGHIYNTLDELHFGVSV